MSIDPSLLAYLDPKDLDARADWAFQHFDWHQRIYREVPRKGFQRYDTYFAFLQDMEDLNGWAYYHSMEHQNITHSIFIGSSPDLSYLDPEDTDAWSDWMDIHSKIHTEIRNALKLI